MGLFFNSRADNIKREIITLVGKINGAIKSLVTEMDNEGITLYNYKRFKSYIYTIDEYHARVNSLILQLPSSKVDSLTVPWLDGRILPFFMYDGSYNLVMTQIETELRQTIEKLNEEEEKKRVEEEKRKREELRKQEQAKRQEEERKAYLQSYEGIKETLGKAFDCKTSKKEVSFVLKSDSDIIIEWGDGTNKTITHPNNEVKVKKEYDSISEHHIHVYGKKMTYLDCSNNQLTSLDINSYFDYHLKYLNCSGNLLHSLRFSNLSLENFLFSNNPIKVYGGRAYIALENLA